MATQPNTYSPLLTDLLFEKAGVGLCLVAPDGTVLRANAEWLRSTPYTAEQVIGENLIELFPATRDQALAMHARARAGHHVEVPRHAQKLNGRERWWEGGVEAVPMEGGTGLLMIAREVTARHQQQDTASPKGADGELRANEERFRAFFHTEAVGTAELALDGHFIAVNDRLCDLTGYSRAELLGMTPGDLTDPDDRGREDPHLSSYLRGDSPTYQAEKRYVRKDGAIIWVQVSAAMVCDASGKPARSAGIVQDITERKQAEEALRENEERLRAAFAASPDAININRLPDGAYVALNERFEQLSLWPRAEVIGKTVVDLNVWVDLEERERLMARLLSSGSVQNAETAFRRRDGSVFTASISAQVFEAKGERFLLAITRDISDLKRAEQSLRETDRRKDEFLGMLSHELRNPLTPIRNSLYVLDHVEPGGQQARQAKEIANRQIAHLTRLVDDLLDVTRIARGKFELRRSELDLGALARRTAEDHGDAANILREVLELDQHVVEVAYTGREGIAKAQAFHPDVVLCDIGLPEMDGYEVARTMRADPELGRVALIAVSGYAQPEDVAMAKEAGFDAHLAKPPSIEALERALAEVGREGATGVDLRGCNHFPPPTPAHAPSAT